MEQVNLLISLLKNSVTILYANDRALFQKKGAERTCAGRIMIYMEHLLRHDPMFEMWRYYNLDCEYHWDEYDQKRYANKDGYMQPDLILHIRDTNEHNLMVVEFKFDAETSDTDVQKLQDLTKLDYKYKYKLGCSVQLSNQHAVYKFYINGQEKDEL